MKLKIKQLLFFATCSGAMLFSALPGTVMAQKAAPALNPILQGYATGASTPNWIDFRQGTTINPQTIFTELKKGFELSNDDDMRVAKVKDGALGTKHYRYQQYYKNLKVIYGEFIVHQKEDGFVYCANGRLITGLKLGNTSSLSEAQGLDAALGFMKAKKYLWQNQELEADLKRQKKDQAATYFPKGELVYAPEGRDATYPAAAYKLVWHFKVYTDDKDVIAKSVYVDALTGKIVNAVDIAMVCSGATGTSAFNGTVAFSTELTGGSYRSHNNCQTTDLYVYNCNGSGASNTFYTDADNTWTSQSAVQCQYGVDRTYDYYNSYHGRPSWNGASGDMIAYNNAFAGSNNACWGCTGNSTIFYAGNTSAATDDWNTDDIVGHEFTHGVTQDEANLVYSNESGALNESFSDIFGEMVESWSEGNCDFLVGADRGAIRSLSNPPSFSDSYAGPMPDTYLGTGWYTGSSDNGGVHHNSSIQNHWFYLLSNGGTGTTDFGIPYSVTGIGRFKARDIAYTALTTYLTTSSQYIDSRQAMLHAALDLYGGCSAEIIAVGDAWHAVGVESQSANFVNNVCGVVASGTFKQAISVLTGANGCANSIATGASITYYAARDRVLLYQGFIAPTGSRFVAYLEPCSSTLFKNGGGDNNSDPRMSDAERGIRPPVVTLRQPVADAALAEQEQGVTVNPNPFHNAFDVALSAKADAKAQVYVYNNLGMKVMEKSGVTVSKGANKITFDGSKLSPGMYLVEVQMGSEKIVKKIVKM